MTTSNQRKGLNRNTIDKYYTNPTVVELCIKYIKQFLIINKNDLIIEPSAGNGAFIQDIKKLTNNYKFYDLVPEHEEIMQQNYLKLSIKLINPDDEKRVIHVIGNPAFGRQSSTAIKFIKKSCEFCDTLSFILPKSFKKDSMKKHFPLKMHLIYEVDLPPNAFLVDGVVHDVPCILSIWKKENYDRIIPKKLSPREFIFVKKENNPHVSFRRVGVNAGIVHKDINNKSSQSHYFIKFNNVDITNKESISDLIKRLNAIEFCHDNTVGPKSISKQELIKKFNEVL